MFKNTDQSYSSDNDPQTMPMIDKNLVINASFSLEHLICSICHYIVWDPVVCGTPTGCHNAYCSQCISLWLQKPHHQCPTCHRPFIKSSVPPILKTMLENLELRCPQHIHGCPTTFKYQQMPFHLKDCQYKLQKCQGCKKKIVIKDFSNHILNCEQIIVQCPKCKDFMTKANFKVHNRTDCFKKQIQTCGERVETVAQSIDEISNSLSKLQQLTKCFLLGEALQLNIQLFTTFNQHFVFPHPTLIKPSFNQNKQKFDFLHFYVVNPIYTDSIASIKWGIKITKMIGSILIGFCSSMNLNSLDFVINKYGEIKRKSPNENKYKLVRKAADFVFGCGDIIKFKYASLPKCIRIWNETKRVGMVLQSNEVDQLGQKVYTFYSMDTLNDSMSFIN